MYLLVLAFAIKGPQSTMKLEEPVPIAVFGVGHYSCAKARLPEQRRAAFAWLMGYVSGRNWGESSSVGRVPMVKA